MLMYVWQKIYKMCGEVIFGTPEINEGPLYLYTCHEGVRSQLSLPTSPTPQPYSFSGILPDILNPNTLICVLKTNKSTVI